MPRAFYTGLFSGQLVRAHFPDGAPGDLLQGYVRFASERNPVNGKAGKMIDSAMFSLDGTASDG
jgi:hypothetical protein